MSIFLCDGERIQFGQPQGQGGAGKFYAHPLREHIGFKIYNRPQEIESQRIEWLWSHPPIALYERGTPTYAWPQAPVYDEASGDLVGFSMERIRGSVPLQAIVNPNARSPAVHHAFLWKVAEGLLKRVQTLHLMPTSHIVGDVNFENFLVSRCGIVSQIDLDSTHFTIRGGPTFTTLRCRPELQPPELIFVRLPVLDRDQDQDAFSVYIVVHRLIREGLHPFDSCYVGSGTPLRLHERIKEGLWPDSLRHPEYRPKPGAVPFDSLPQTLQDLFRQMFLDGHTDRTKRPNVTDLLNCLQMHRPLGTKRARIGRMAWNREFHRQPAKLTTERFAAAAKTHKKKIAIAAIALLGVGTGLQQIGTAPKSLKAFPNHKNSADDSAHGSPLTTDLPRIPQGTPFLAPTPRTSDGPALPTPKLWRQANGDAI